MTQDLLEYPKMMERAVRGVLREALSIAAEHGLSGQHHFYITFRTEAPGVSISDQLRAQYPVEMTIVLENQFWDLEIGEECFSVSLSFNRVPQQLVIPFEAVTSFVDPSVKFGLQFGTQPDGAETAAPDTPAAEAEPEQADDGAPEDGEDSAPEDGEDSGENTDGGQVITLDSFRKK